uniref:protein O-GlcNAc transferase n=1 Tax=Geobacter sp. (strain M21) TaxID=443144 RepID=C6E7I2_GEOSM
MGYQESAESQARLKYVDLLLKKGMQEEARTQLQQLVQEDPGCARGWYLLAVLVGEQGHPDQAAKLLRQALRAEPENVKALNALGVALQQMGERDQAAACYGEALRIDPRFQEARVNLALFLKVGMRLAEAEALLSRGIALEPASVRLRYNYANVLHYQGRSLEAAGAYREVLRLDPQHLDARQNLLFALHYSPQFSDRRIFAEHLRAARSAPFRLPPSPSVPRRGGRIRIGYLSPDFRSHAVASFIEPVLKAHDRERFEIFCYANLPRPDRVTERVKALSEHWRDLYNIPDQIAALMIAADALDVLIDLAGHTSGNRLPLFARRPAPLQITWIGYPDTTGLKQMDYRITDRHADPPGKSERYHTETLLRLPRSFSCFLPPQEAPEVAPVPCLATGAVTFGSFNNLAKVTPETIALWCRVLDAVPGSRLLLKGRPFADSGVRERIASLFARGGIAGERVELHPGEPENSAHLAQYGRVDIALDTFPYNGTTTTCEALWMGVPVVTLAGTRHAARTGASILTNCGLDELVAEDEGEYLEIARRLAADRGRLSEFRKGARERLAASPLLDAAGVTRELEAALEGVLKERGVR